MHTCAKLLKAKARIMAFLHMSIRFIASSGIPFTHVWTTLRGSKALSLNYCALLRQSMNMRPASESIVK